MFQQSAPVHVNPCEDWINVHLFDSTATPLRGARRAPNRHHHGLSRPRFRIAKMIFLTPRILCLFALVAGSAAVPALAQETYVPGAKPKDKAPSKKDSSLREEGEALF